jgi:hypothetical protein
MLRELRERLARALGRPRRERFLRHLPRGSVGAEVGVFRGQFTRHILDVVRPSRLHLVDAWWLLYGERYPDWGAYTDHGRLGTREAYEEVREILRRHDRAGVAVIHVADDLQCLAGFPPETFDWVYLDSSHEYEHTRRELALLVPRMKRGGVICGDDWHDDPAHEHHGVAKAVRELCAREGWTLAERDAFGQWLIKASALRGL